MFIATSLQITVLKLNLILKGLREIPFSVIFSATSKPSNYFDINNYQLTDPRKTESWFTAGKLEITVPTIISLLCVSSLALEPSRMQVTVSSRHRRQHVQNHSSTEFNDRTHRLRQAILAETNKKRRFQKVVINYRKLKLFKLGCKRMIMYSMANWFFLWDCPHCSMRHFEWFAKRTYSLQSLQYLWCNSL